MSLPATSLRTLVMPQATVRSNVALISGGVLFLALLAQIAIPVPGSPVPVTGQTLGVLLLGTTYGASLGASTFTFYLLAGIAGAPVFAQHSFGIAKVTGATGGYLIGMLIATYFLGLIARKSLDREFLTALPSMLFASTITFTFGLLWLHHFTGQSWKWTIQAGFTPFIIGEVLKIAIAGTSLPILWRFVNRKRA